MGFFLQVGPVRDHPGVSCIPQERSTTLPPCSQPSMGNSFLQGTLLGALALGCALHAPSSPCRCNPGSLGQAAGGRKACARVINTPRYLAVLRGCRTQAWSCMRQMASGLPAVSGPHVLTVAGSQRPARQDMAGGGALPSLRGNKVQFSVMMDFSFEF